MQNGQDQLDRAREILLNNTLEPAERIQRQYVLALMPEIHNFRIKGFTWLQLTDLLKECNVNLHPSTVRGYYCEMMKDKMEDCIRQMDQQISLLMSAEKINIVDKPSETTIAVSRNYKCNPFPPGIKPLPRREGVEEAVYDSDELMEHPAIPGLMLSKKERVCGAYLDYVDGNGVMKIETSLEKRFRIKWEKPIPMTKSSTSKDFVEMDYSLFAKKRKL